MRRIIAVAAVTAIALGTSGCAVGFNAATTLQQASGNGQNLAAGELTLRNLSIVIDPELPGAATLDGTIVNNADAADTLVSVSGQSGTITLNAPIALPTGVGVRLGHNATQVASLSTPASGLPAGTWIDLKLEFASAGTVETKVLVQTNTGDHADVAVSFAN